MMKLPLLVMGWAVLTLSCSPEKGAQFILLPPGDTGITFSNEITESDSLNILKEANIYNGGGVAVGDFNRDGLADIYFAGNMVSNKLYLNKGEMQFEDVTAVAGVKGEGKWCMGVAAADINHDGWLDLYVSASFLKDPERRENLLYINQGPNEDGIPVFKESAEAYGLNDSGYSTQGVFFDYDKDGDLDLYLVTNTLYDERTPIRFREKRTDGSALNTDRLYRNNGNGTFSNVSQKAGILIEGWGHAASISDFNRDGWPDIYVSNDFVANDLLYINNRDGTFTNRIGAYFKHTAWYAMGSDAVDINNDGLVDLVSLEMLPETNLRKKTMLSGNEYYNYFNANKYGYQHQYIRNVLQVNQGLAPGGHPVFSDVAFLSDMYQTDWSWNPLVADFDNDGYRDLIVTNGLPRDVTDLDYIKFNNGLGYNEGDGKATLAMTDSLPVVNISNYAFRNNQQAFDGAVVFSDSTRAWGLVETSFSNGAAYADFDNDGDLDLVISNLNTEAFLYENNIKAAKVNHQIAVHLEGGNKNTQAVGATLKLFYGDGKHLYYEHYPVRGYLSTVSNTVHFGLGEASEIDSLLVSWPDGSIQWLRDIAAGTPLTLRRGQAEITARQVSGQSQTNAALFGKVNDPLGIHYRHKERDAVDYNIQPLLPHKLSQYGPGIAVGDIDRNGWDDFYIGGPAGKRGIFFIQYAEGKFKKDSTRIAGDHIPHEDMGVLFFDADRDGDLDLYKAAGSYELAPGHPNSQDNLYLNNGKGYFSPAGALPPTRANGSCVRAADFDSDGDLDVFVGGRSVSGAYPTAPESYLLRNDDGEFTDVTTSYCPELKHIGMVTDALWSDFNGDGRVDLVLTGEWMAVTFLKNTGEGLVSLGEGSGINHLTGWWNSLSSGDFDGDGDMDYVAGNLGLNSSYKASESAPMTILSKDFENNRREELIIFTHEKGGDGVRRPYPVHTRDDMIRQSTAIRRRFPTFESFGRVSMGGIWTEEERQDVLTMEATHLASSYIENKGNGEFAMRSLPFEAQVAPVFGMVTRDINGDSHLDILMVGNDYGMDPMAGRHDAFNGLCLLGDGKGGFKSLSIAESGFYVKGDGKALAVLSNENGGEYIIATQNKDSVLVFSRERQKQELNIPLGPSDFQATIFYEDGTKALREFYYGSGFLSQSGRRIKYTDAVEKIVVRDYAGNEREIEVK